MTRLFSLFLISASIVLISLSFALFSPGDELPRIIGKLMTYQGKRPEEKLFVHLDKPYYAAGETIWFKTYLVDGTYHRLDSSFSKAIYVDLVDSKHQVLDQVILYSPAGSSYGDFSLSDSLPQGRYLLRAYTNYMKNKGEDFFFLKEFEVINAQTSVGNTDETPGVIDLQFFPEGGYLVSGVENRISFKAINKFGKSVDIAGEIVDDTNKVLATFTSEHNGMGSFKMFVWPNKKYYAKVSNPTGASKDLIALPAVKETGYLMQITETKESIRVMIYNNSPRSPENPVLFNLLGQTRGEVHFAASGELKGTTVTANILKSKFPTGVAQLTLFDGTGVPQCERLVFIDHEERLTMTVETNKESYGKREKVELNILVRNEKQEPVAGDFSISIYDEATVQDREAYPTTIVDYLLLSTDLTGSIEDPSYYFKDRLPETVRHLDLVMLTHGWRRFTWKDVLQDALPPLAYYAEKGIRVSGLVTGSLSKKPVANGKLKILSAAGELVMIETDGEGKFYTDEFAHYDSTKLAIHTDNAKGKQRELTLALDPYPVPYTSSYSFSLVEDLKADKFLEQLANKKKADDTYTLGKDTKLLEEVTVEEKRIEPASKSKIYGTPSAHLKMDKIPTHTYTNILQAIQGRIPGVVVRGTPPAMSVTLRAGNASPLFLLDGTPVDLDVIMSVQPANIDYVDVIRGPAAAIYGNRGMNGVLAIYSKNPSEGINRPSVGIQHLIYPGFYPGREFYTPQYDVPQGDHARADIRSTLYWNPVVETDDKGHATVSFFTADEISDYRIIIQGISFHGLPGFSRSGLNTR